MVLGEAGALHGHVARIRRRDGPPISSESGLVSGKRACGQGSAAIYENSFTGLPHYIEVLNARGYSYGIDYVPHDAMVPEWGAGGGAGGR